MTALRAYLTSFAAAFVGAASAYAADPIEFEVDGQVSAVAGLVDGDADADVNARIRVVGSTVLDNGVTLGLGLEGRFDEDQPSQIFPGGRYSSVLIGGPRGVAPLSGDAYLQGAYAYAKGSFGQIIVGRDKGVARTLAVTSPTIFSAVNVNDWLTDLSGLNDIHTVNDFTGYSTKVTYMPPANVFGGALGGLRVGISYSPVLRQCGDQLCAPRSGFVMTPDGALLTETSKWDDGVEAALYYQKNLGDGFLVGLGASYVTADEDSLIDLPVYDDYEAYSLGMNLAYRGITLGGSIKTTNAGLADAGDDGYLAFDAGITYRTGDDSGDWGFMLGYGQSEANAIGQNPIDPTLFRDTQTAQAGVTYMVSRGITVGAAAQYVEADKPLTVGGPEEAATVVIESSIRF